MFQQSLDMMKYTEKGLTGSINNEDEYMENLTKAIVFDRRDGMPPVIEDEKDKKIKELEKTIRALENQIAHLRWVANAQSFV